MKKENNIATIIIGIIGIIGIITTGLLNNYQIAQLRTEIAHQQEEINQSNQSNNDLIENTTITRVVNIYKDGEGGAQTLSLTPQGWLDFMRTYPGAGSTISNIDFEDMFTFTKIDSWYSEEVQEFLEMEKTEFWIWTPVAGYDGNLHGGDFVMYYNEYRDGIRLLFHNGEDDVQVEFELSGAKHAKEIYTFGNGYYNSLYYLVFEDREGKVMAINEKMEMYQLGACDMTNAE